MPEEVGPPNGGFDAEASLRLGQQRVVAAGKAGAHLAERARARLRRDAVEHQARGLALGRAPVGRARRHQIGLRAQDHAVLDHLEAVGGERRAGGRDVDDQLGGAGRRRALGRARAFHDAVVGDAVRGEEVAREIHVFGGDAHLALVLEAERGRDVVEVGHAVHVDPGLRHRHHHVGMAEAEPVDEDDVLVGVGDHLAHQVFAGEAEMHRALRQQLDDLGGREIGHLDAGKVGDGAAIVARAARLDELEPGAREEGFRVLLQPALGRHRDDERRAHVPPRNAASRSIQTAKPTAGIALGAAEPREQPVIASAGDQRPGVACGRIVQLEHEAGVVVEAAAEGGGELDAADVDAARGQKAGAALEQIERGIERDLGVAGKGAQLGRGLVGIAADGEEFLDQRARLPRQRGLRPERRLLEKAIGDLADRAPADGGDAGDREQVGDQRMRGLGIGAGERSQHALVFRPSRARR